MYITYLLLKMENLYYLTNFCYFMFLTYSILFSVNYRFWKVYYVDVKSSFLFIKYTNFCLFLDEFIGFYETILKMTQVVEIVKALNEHIQKKCMKKHWIFYYFFVVLHYNTDTDFETNVLLNVFVSLTKCWVVYNKYYLQSNNMPFKFRCRKESRWKKYAQRSKFLNHLTPFRNLYRIN